MSEVSSTLHLDHRAVKWKLVRNEHIINLTLHTLQMLYNYFPT